MGASHPVTSVPELFAHALAIEREASERYLEFARCMAEHENPIVAELFFLLARNELDHAMRLERQVDGMTLPKIDAIQYAWLDAAAPETALHDAAHDFLWHFMRPYHALKIALKSERRAKAFFEEIAAGDVDADIRELAEEMAREERSHVQWVEEALARQSAPYPDWNTVWV